MWSLIFVPSDPWGTPTQLKVKLGTSGVQGPRNGVSISITSCEITQGTSGNHTKRIKSKIKSDKTQEMRTNNTNVHHCIEFLNAFGEIISHVCVSDRPRLYDLGHIVANDDKSCHLNKLLGNLHFHEPVSQLHCKTLCMKKMLKDD